MLQTTKRGHKRTTRHLKALLMLTETLNVEQSMVLDDANHSCDARLLLNKLYTNL